MTKQIVISPGLSLLCNNHGFRRLAVGRTRPKTLYVEFYQRYYNLPNASSTNLMQRLFTFNEDVRQVQHLCGSLQTRLQIPNKMYKLVHIQDYLFEVVDTEVGMADPWIFFYEL